MPKLIISGGPVLDGADRANIYQLLADHGLLDAACGGCGRCGKCGVIFADANEPVLADDRKFFCEEELAAGWRLSCLHFLDQDKVIALPRKEKAARTMDSGLWKEIVPDRAWGIGLAVDIGTTTLAASLLDLASGKRLAGAARLNSQKSFGQDVITRIDYAASHRDGLAKMAMAVRGDIAAMAGEACARAGCRVEDIKCVTVAANNVMTHIFGEKDPSSLAAYPFTPAFTGPLQLPGNAPGLPFAAQVPVWCLPAISAYVGGDITGGMLVCSLDELQGNVLFIDIGTNGEMVLARGGEMVSCSCAAGPALEGMDISCGMRAAEGAIEDVVLGSDGCSVQISTIGNSEPLGLCGSGLLALISQLVQAGIIAGNGRLQDHPLVDKAEGKKRFIVDRERDIYLSQRDVRQVQLAKGAILAGVNIMLQEIGLAAGQVDKVLVAGQFGAHLPASSLIGAGLLPAAFGGRMDYVGNTSLSGAAICLLSGEQRQKACSFPGQVNYLELSAWDGYERALMKAMSFC